MNFVEPIRDRKKIAHVKNQLWGQRRYRDLLLFVVGINTALGNSDLLELQVKDFLNDNQRSYLRNEAHACFVQVLLQRYWLGFNQRTYQSITQDGLYKNKTRYQPFSSDSTRFVPQYKFLRNPSKL